MLYRRSIPFDELFDAFRDFDSLFQRAMPAAGAASRLVPGEVASWPSKAWTSTFHPAVESFTKDGSLVLRAELPGVDPSEVEVNLVGNQLSIRGEKREQRESEDGGAYLMETAYGKFERSFTLPEGVKPDQVKARYANGVLEVTLPSQDQAARKVTVEVAAEPGRKSIKAAS